MRSSSCTASVALARAQPAHECRHADREHDAEHRHEQHGSRPGSVPRCGCDGASRGPQSAAQRQPSSTTASLTAYAADAAPFGLRRRSARSPGRSRAAAARGRRTAASVRPAGRARGQVRIVAHARRSSSLVGAAQRLGERRAAQRGQAQLDLLLDRRDPRPGRRPPAGARSPVRAARACESVAVVSTSHGGPAPQARRDLQVLEPAAPRLVALARLAAAAATRRGRSRRASRRARRRPGIAAPRARGTRWRGARRRPTTLPVR